MPVAAGAAAGHPGSRGADPIRRDRARRPPHLLDDIIGSPAGIPGIRWHGRRQDHAAGRRRWAPSRRRTHRLRRGRRRTGAPPSASGETRRPLRQRGRRRRGDGARSGEAGAEDAARPHRGRRGSRRRGRRPARGAQHRPRRRRGHRARQQPRRGARPAGGAGRARRARPRGAAQPAGAAVQVVLHVGRDRDGTSPARARSRCCGRGVDGRVRVATAWHADRGFDGHGTSEAPARGGRRS